MVTYRHPYIAQEGWWLLALVWSAAGLVGWGVGSAAALPLVLVGGLLLFLFRDPQRRIPSNPLGIVSPVDGLVLRVTDEPAPIQERRPSHCVVIRQGFFSVRSLRCPIEGRVMERWRKRKGSNTLLGYLIRTDEDDEVLWALVTPRFGLTLDLQPGQRVGQGQRCGFAYLPVTTALYLPPASRVEVKVGARVRSGEVVLAEFVHREGEKEKRRLMGEVAHALS